MNAPYRRPSRSGPRSDASIRPGHLPGSACAAAPGDRAPAPEIRPARNLAAPGTAAVLLRPGPLPAAPHPSPLAPSHPDRRPRRNATRPRSGCSRPGYAGS